MALVEIARFYDVIEADLAAAFLASHDIEVTVTERFQTTVDPLMQRALGIRLLGNAVDAEAARTLLARAGSGEFATDEGDDTPPRDGGTQVTATALALFTAGLGTFWGPGLPRRFRTVPWQGVLLAMVATGGLIAVILGLEKVLFDPPR